MSESTWSNAEKRLAREVFEEAALAEEAELLQIVRSKATAATTMEDAWALRCFLDNAERESFSRSMTTDTPSCSSCSGAWFGRAECGQTGCLGCQQTNSL